MQTYSVPTTTHKVTNLARAFIAAALIVVAADRYLTLGGAKQKLLITATGTALVLVLVKWRRSWKSTHIAQTLLIRKTQDDNAITQLEILSIFSLLFVLWHIRTNPWPACVWGVISAGLHRQYGWARWLFIGVAIIELTIMFHTRSTFLGKTNLERLAMLLAAGFLILGIFFLTHGRAGEVFNQHQ
jgi:hypothetical protein